MNNGKYPLVRRKEMYFTYATTNANKQLSIYDLLTNNVPNDIKVSFKTISDDSEKFRNYYNTHTIKSIPIAPEGLPTEYRTFSIPKKTGGFRTIDAPNDMLKLYLTIWKEWFEQFLPHNATHAYVKGRSTVTALQAHQENESKWFMKIDLHNFFPSHNLPYVMQQLSKIYPFQFLFENDNYKQSFIENLVYGFKDGKLPQGTPLSPVLTNICMVPIDYKIQKMLWDKKSNFCYTRYADDMIISSPYKFDSNLIQEEIIKILDEENTPFELNKEKTRFGSSSGRNWNLGLMLNKDNNITIGYRAKQKIKKDLYKFSQNPDSFSYKEKHKLGGMLSYYSAVEPGYVKYIENKYNVSPLTFI